MGSRLELRDAGRRRARMAGLRQSGSGNRARAAGSGGRTQAVRFRPSGSGGRTHAVGSGRHGSGRRTQAVQLGPSDSGRRLVVTTCASDPAPFHVKRALRDGRMVPSSERRIKAEVGACASTATSWSLDSLGGDRPDSAFSRGTDSGWHQPGPTTRRSTRQLSRWTPHRATHRTTVDATRS